MYSPAGIRAFGSRLVTMRTIDGDAFEGRFVHDLVGDDAIVVLFASEGDAGEPFVVRLDGIAAVVER